MESYRDFIYEFDNEKIYTRRDLANIRKSWEDSHKINRVIMIGKDFDIALQIVKIRETPEGLLIEVK